MLQNLIFPVDKVYIWELNWLMTVLRVSSKKQKTDWAALLKASKAAHGILKDYDPKDNPLRRPGAKNFLGRWDRPDYKVRS